ncbi:MAG: hypothetical protein M1823_000779 [Watsoniomyces obsoletus]|nr:MAG: hypothetical protein M1823_000779 [Watsoniomyces obsoletus]
MRLADAIHELQHVPPKTSINHFLKKLGPEEKLDELLDVLRVGEVTKEHTIEAVWEAWDYLLLHRLWALRYSDLKALQMDINYDGKVKPVLEQYALFSTRTTAEGQTIMKHWGVWPSQAFPSHLNPSRLGKTLLEELCRLCKICELSKAVALLEAEVARRKATRGTLKVGYILPMDVCKVRREMSRAKTKKTRSLVKDVVDSTVLGSSSKRSLSNRIEITRGEIPFLLKKESEENDTHDIPSVKSSVKSEDDGNPNSGKSEFALKASTAAITLLAIEDCTGNIKKEEETLPDVNTEVKQEQVCKASFTGPEGIIFEKEQSMETNKENRTADGNLSIEQSVRELDDTFGQANPLKRKRDKQSQHTRCACHASLTEFKIQIPTGTDTIDETAGLVLIQQIKMRGFKLLCHSHLRFLAGGAAALHNNHTARTLKHRLRRLSRRGFSRTRKKHPDWFRKLQGSRACGDVLYKFPTVPSRPFDFDAPRVFERFAGHGRWSEWETQGTVNIAGFFSYLVDDTSMSSLIDDEFDMYQHHYQPKADRTMGFLRIMWYSLTQQAIRQDPAYYAAVVAARPDKNWKLISYPYYTKDTNRPGEKTGFFHLDLNVEDYVRTRKGGNIVQGSVSLDDETIDGCTLLVPGFHRHIDAWWARVRKRKADKGEDPPTGFTTNIGTGVYTAEDKEEFGRFIPVPCTKGSIRISRPEIVHGSTAVSTLRRRTIFPWFTGIREDHETLDNEESERWSELSAYHRDLIPCMKTPSGYSSGVYGRPETKFPAAIRLQSTSAIGDALIGARRWDDASVIKERNVLFGRDEEASWEFVRLARQRILSNLREAFEQLKQLEAEQFGENAFFGGNAERRKRNETKRNETEFVFKNVARHADAPSEERGSFVRPWNHALGRISDLWAWGKRLLTPVRHTCRRPPVIRARCGFSTDRAGATIRNNTSRTTESAAGEAQIGNPTTDLPSASFLTHPRLLSVFLGSVHFSTFRESTTPFLERSREPANPLAVDWIGEWPTPTAVLTDDDTNDRSTLIPARLYKGLEARPWHSYVPSIIGHITVPLGITVMFLPGLLSLLVGLGVCSPLNSPFGPKPLPPDPFCPALPKPAGSPFLTPSLGYQLRMVGLTISTLKYTCNSIHTASPPRLEQPAAAPLYDLSPLLNDKELLRKLATKAVFSMKWTKAAQFGKMDWDLGWGGPVMYGGPLLQPFFRGPLASNHAPPENPLNRGLDNEPPLTWARFNYPQDVQKANPPEYSDIAYRVHTVGGAPPDSCEGQPPSFTRKAASQWYFYYPQDSQGMRGVKPAYQLCKPPPPLYHFWKYW